MPTPLTADAVIDLLGLEPLPHEGGAFRETYRAEQRVPNPLAAHNAENAEDATRSASTQIYYLLRAGETSALHRVRSDEVFHHYLGDPVIQLRIDDRTETFEPQARDSAPTTPLATPPKTTLDTIGTDLAQRHRPQVVAPRHVWQGAVLADDTPQSLGFALLGCTVAPGFEWADFELITPDRANLLAQQFPEHAALIETLTPAPGRTRA